MSSKLRHDGTLSQWMKFIWNFNNRKTHKQKNKKTNFNQCSSSVSELMANKLVFSETSVVSDHRSPFYCSYKACMQFPLSTCTFQCPDFREPPWGTHKITWCLPSASRHVNEGLVLYNTFLCRPFSSHIWSSFLCGNMTGSTVLWPWRKDVRTWP